MNNDLIKRSDVERMLTALGGCDASDKEAEGWDKAIDAALEGLRKVESANKWIPCSEKLPSDPCWDWRGIDAPCPKVEITTVDRERYIGYFMGGGWYDINGNCIDVVAWKEPSEPWEGE